MNLRIFLFHFFLVLALCFQAQITDNFSDGNFSQNPTWQGSAADFLVNGTSELQLSSAVAGASHLSTPHVLASLANTEWQIKVRQPFSPSSSNFGKVFLTADNADLNLVQNGYYLLFGETGSTDAIRLFNLTNGTAT